MPPALKWMVGINVPYNHIPKGQDIVLKYWMPGSLAKYTVQHKPDF
jgi:hypothetical protein